MSTYLEAKSDVILDRSTGLLFPRSAGRDNNLVPDFGSRDVRNSSLERFTAGFRPSDAEGIAQFCERMAQSYDSGCVKARGKRLNGLQAYNLWANRFRKHGVYVREPRISEIYYGHMPPHFIRPGSYPKGLECVSIAKGDALTELQFRLLVDAGIRLNVEIPSPYCSGRTMQAAVGFVSVRGIPFVYAKGCYRRGYECCFNGRDNPVALQSFSGGRYVSEHLAPYGDAIPFSTVSEASSQASIVLLLPESGNESPYFFEAITTNERFGSLIISEEAACFEPPALQRLKERIELHMPELTPRLYFVNASWLRNYGFDPNGQSIRTQVAEFYASLKSGKPPACSTNQVGQLEMLLA
jgi:hypothetical protein